MAGEWIAPKARTLYAKFFPGDWEDKGGDLLEGRCPAEGAHTGGSARTDCRVFLSYGPQGQPPGIYCLHKSCLGQLEPMNAAFREALFSYDKEPGRSYKPAEEGVVKRAPREKEQWIPEYNEAKLRGVVLAVPPVNEAWFMERSPVDVRGIGPAEFIEQVFQPEDRVMVFTSFFSQGEYLWEVGRGGYRLAEQRGVKAVRSKLPVDGGKDGIWYLSNPVDGQWHANPRRDGKFSRRSEESVTAWRHLVLESDKAPEDLWMRFLAMAPVSVVAIYSSGGRSWHALVRVDQPDKASFDALLRTHVKPTLPLLGADPGALTPVRLTRLPGCTRGGREQRLIYLNPRASYAAPKAIIDLPKVRVL